MNGKINFILSAPILVMVQRVLAVAYFIWKRKVRLTFRLWKCGIELGFGNSIDIEVGRDEQMSHSNINNTAPSEPETNETNEEIPSTMCAIM